MQQLQQLLKIYWAGDGTETVCQQILDMLNEREAEINVAFKNEFEGEVSEKCNLLEGSDAEYILKNIHEKIKIPDPANTLPAKMFRLPVRTIGWAAAAIICIFSSVALFKYTSSDKNSKAVTSIPGDKKSVVNTIENKNKIPLEFYLSDSSFVVLFPGSALTCKEQFDDTYRSLNLKGKALFKVAKDVSRPFTVYADGVATTALGTEFSVSTLMGVNKVHVKLSEGEVVVRSFFNDMARKDVYLKAGQECTVDTHYKEVPVKSFKEENTGHNGTETRKANKNLQALEFSKESLDKIFEKISKHFNVEIRYTNRKIKNLSFTGQFKPNDSLPMILTIICSTNDLSFERKGTLITVRD